VDINGDGAELMAQEIAAGGGDAFAVRSDLTDLGDVESMLTAVLDRRPRVDVLFSNAGGISGFVPFLELSPQDWRHTIEMNLFSAFYVGSVVARHMAATGGGAIVYTSSQLASVARQGMIAYTTAKAGIEHLVRGMALELAPHGIRVNAVAPGPTEHSGTREVFAQPDVVEFHERMIPMGRAARPDEITGAAIYLASDAASFTTGSILTVDGGYTIV
jgi:NAD(P)-dependent dehydrogenase (short-subunit alcohol dehydrogenase family)